MQERGAGTARCMACRSKRTGSAGLRCTYSPCERTPEYRASVLEVSSSMRATNVVGWNVVEVWEGCRYGRDAGMVWGTGGLDQTRAEIWTPGARLAASLMPLSQPPDFIYFQPVGRAPATTGRDVRASAGAQPAPGPWLEPGQIAPPSDARLALGWRWGPLSLQPRNQTKHSERQPCVAFLMQGLAHAAEDLSRITRLFLALFAEDASERN